MSIGPHTIRVMRDGYSTGERRLVLTANQPSQTAAFTLTAARPQAQAKAAATAPMPVVVRFESRPTGASVYLDGSTLEQLRTLDQRYNDRAYAFVLAALEEVVQRLPRRRHVSGGELVSGCRDLALRLYGPMAKTVLQYWNVRTTRDIGEVVFNLLEVGVLSKDEADSRNDFDDLFDFTEVFETNYPWGGRSLA